MPANTRLYWLSFADPDRPTGQQFLGACVVEVSTENAELAKSFIPLDADENAAWIAAALRNAWALKCNPGGEVLSAQLPLDNPHTARYPRGQLMDRQTIAALDAEPVT